MCEHKTSRHRKYVPICICNFENCAASQLINILDIFVMRRQPEIITCGRITLCIGFAMCSCARVWDGGDILFSFNVRIYEKHVFYSLLAVLPFAHCLNLYTLNIVYLPDVYILFMACITCIQWSAVKL